MLLALTRIATLLRRLVPPALLRRLLSLVLMPGVRAAAAKHGSAVALGVLRHSRHIAAALLMVAGISAAVAGAYVNWGTGTALLVSASCLIPLALVVGWER